MTWLRRLLLLIFLTLSSAYVLIFCLRNSTKVNIDLEKAKELKLAELRSLRDEELVKLDQIFMIAFEKGEDLTEIKERKSFLRDATEPLKSLKVEGVDDEAVLNQIRELATLEV